MTRGGIKTLQEIEIMAEGGRKLAAIRDRLASEVRPGVSGLDLEKTAVTLIAKTGGEASFKKVPGYAWATCINVNDTVVHGIPSPYKFKSGDKVAIDVGLFYRGFHTDTSVTVLAGRGSKADMKFLEVGRKGLALAIQQARIGNRVMDISRAMQETAEGAGYSMVRALTGHGVGRNLHEEPAIPCFVMGQYRHSPAIVPGMVLAIEIMYNAGKSDVVYKNSDGWTISTADGKISGLFEETVAVTKSGPVVLTRV